MEKWRKIVRDLPMRPREVADKVQILTGIDSDLWVTWWTGDAAEPPPKVIQDGISSVCAEIHAMTGVMVTQVDSGVLDLTKAESADVVTWIALGRALAVIAARDGRHVRHVRCEMTGWSGDRQLLPWTTRMLALVRAQGLTWMEVADLVGLTKGPNKKRAVRARMGVLGQDDEATASVGQRIRLAKRKIEWLISLEHRMQQCGPADVPQIGKNDVV